MCKEPFSDCRMVRPVEGMICRRYEHARNRQLTDVPLVPSTTHIYIDQKVGFYPKEALRPLELGSDQECCQR